MLTKKIAIFAGTLAAVFCLSLSFALTRAQISPESGKGKAVQQATDRKAAFPVVNFWDVDSTDESQNRKGQKYSKIVAIEANPTANSTASSSLHTRELLSSPLPIEKSQIVVTGEVVEAKAHLSPNKVSVYSEFKIRVDKIYKNETNQRLSEGSYVFGERRGGIVRFPGGFEQWVYIIGQGMPSPRKRYLFFLTYESLEMKPQSVDLFILTAYELATDRVRPLDDVDNDDNPTKFYRNKESPQLLADLVRKLNDSPKETPK